MEWFTIYKLYKSKKNIIIHTGLYHSEKILYLLVNLYKYKLLSQDGINTISQAENKENQANNKENKSNKENQAENKEKHTENNFECISIPTFIDNIL